jgi:hypothetical protein
MSEKKGSRFCLITREEQRKRQISLLYQGNGKQFIYMPTIGQAKRKLYLAFTYLYLFLFLYLSAQLQFLVHIVGNITVSSDGHTFVYSLLHYRYRYRY